MARYWTARAGFLIGIAVGACRPDHGPRNDDARAAALTAPHDAGAAALPGLRRAELMYAPHPEAGWRRAPVAQLKCVVLWFSQILIRFSGARIATVSFDLADWSSVPPPPTRSRAEALALASHLASLAQREPLRFGEFARRYSEDLTTRDRGGSLGGTSADQLKRWPAVLDALAATAPGQVSRVVETEYGFHILYRSPPPPEKSAAGAHIVIAHDDARWIRFVARGAIQRRSRADAISLAAHLYELLRQQPDRFDELVDRYSDHRDATRRGDFGTWSNRAPTPFTREVEVLTALAVGEVAPPLDTRFGIQIIRRLPNVERRDYAMTAIRLRYDPKAKLEEPLSRLEVGARANALAKGVTSDPKQFGVLQKELCCPFVERWEDGRGSPVLTTLLERMQPGEIAKEPVETDSSFVIAKRLVLEPPTWPSTVYDLPDAPVSIAAPPGSSGQDTPVACAHSQSWIVKPGD